MQRIRALGVRAGITLNPKTAVETVFDIGKGELADEVLIMSVEPGFGGQKYMTDVEQINETEAALPNLDIAITRNRSNECWVCRKKWC